MAAKLRESGGGLGGVRAIGIDLGERAQVSTNVHDPISVPLGAVIEQVRALAAPHGARPVAGELVGLVPAAALRELPEDVPLRGFDPARHVIENRLGRGGWIAFSVRWLRRSKKRRRKHKGTQGGRDRPPPPRPAPDARGGSRAGAAQLGAEARPGAELGQRLQARPDRRRDLLRARRDAASARRSAGALVLSLVMLAMYVPIGYYMDRFFYRRRLAQARREAQLRKQQR